MKRVKRIMAVILVVAMAITMGEGMSMKRAQASDYQNARVLSLSSGWTSDYYLTETDDEHWYKFVVPSDGKVELKIMHYMDYVHVDLYNQDLSEKLRSDYFYDGSETSPETDTIGWELSQGTYYVKIIGYDGRYKMHTSYYSYGVTDQGAYSYDSPQIFSLGKQMVGALTWTDREDWYKFKITKASTYVFKLTRYMDYGCVDLYNQDLSEKIYGRSFYGGSETSPEVDSWELTLSPGTYYIKIAGYNGKYLLDMNRLTQSNCSHDYESSYVSATYLKKGYTLHKCGKCGKTYKDNYIAKKKLGAGYIWSYGMTAGKKKFTVSYQGIYDVSGYQIRYSTNKKFKKSVKVVKAGKNTRTKTIRKLKRKKRYYVQVRGYKKTGGKTVYGKWSGKRSVKTK